MADGRRDRREPGAFSPSRAVERYLRRWQQDSTDESVQSFHYRLKRFVEFCEDEGIERVDDIRPFDLDEFYERRAAEVAPATLKGQMHTVRGFVRYLEQIGAVDDDLAESVQVPTLSKEDEVNEEVWDYQIALTALDHWTEHDPGCRDHVLTELLLVTGARRSGIRALDVQDVHLDEQFIEFVNRPDTGTRLKKGYDGERPVAIPQRTVDVLQQWLDNRRPDTRDEHGRLPLLPSQQGRPVVTTIQGWVYQATEPCNWTTCPHGRDPDSCDWRRAKTASQCPSSYSPHPVRSASMTYQRDLGFPKEVVAERCDASIAVVDKHYDAATARQRMEERRRQFVDRFDTQNSQDTDDQ
jgi:site-specific recombinase XerD